MAFLLFRSFIYRKDLEIAATAGQYIAASYPDADTFLQVFWEEEELHSRILRTQLRHLAQQIEQNHYGTGGPFSVLPTPSIDGWRNLLGVQHQVAAARHLAGQFRIKSLFYCLASVS